MFEKGQICQMKIVDMSNEGQGIGRADGLAVFVPGAVVGDVVTVGLTKVKKNYAFSSLKSVDEPSVNRMEPICNDGFTKGCGGCSLARLNYKGQLELKEKQLGEKLRRLGDLADPIVRPIVAMEDPFNYRNKAQFPISTGGVITRKGGILENLGEVAIGFYKPRSHDVVNCNDCMIQSPAAVAVAQAVRQFMKEDNITAWDDKWEKGLMRHLIVKTAFNTKEVMAILVINGNGIPNGEKLAELIDDAVFKTGYSLESVILNVNKKKTSQVMGKECISLAGKPTILEKVGDLSFEISPHSFYQVNPVQMEKLYDKVREYAALTGKEKVLDLYCGVGSIGLYCANQAANVMGIESEKSAVLDANRNAVVNGIVNARFLCGRAEVELPKLLEETESEDPMAAMVKDTNVIILDPPRSGCPVEFLKTVASVGAERIVYVSCDPATLARDVKVLWDLGYRFQEATPVDMFPWTVHVETVVLMSRVEK
ncbi:MAG: 23S rRNA (uracil(1939)-C(5))-methyltransferase RlmD [Anaerovoracaceae bacterium]